MLAPNKIVEAKCSKVSFTCFLWVFVRDSFFSLSLSIFFRISANSLFYFFIDVFSFAVFGTFFGWNDFSSKLYGCCHSYTFTGSVRLLLSSSFQLFICLLPGCLFRLSNDKCILRANIGEHRMWFGLDGSVPLLLVLLLSHIMLNPLAFLIFFSLPFFLSLVFFFTSPCVCVFVCHSGTLASSFLTLRPFFPCNAMCSTYVSFHVFLCVPNVSRLITTPTR